MSWAMELSKLDIKYAPSASLKKQVSADFIVEFSIFPDKGGYASPMKPWQVFVDSYSYWAGGEVWVRIITNEGEEHD